MRKGLQIAALCLLGGMAAVSQLGRAQAAPGAQSAAAESDTAASKRHPHLQQKITLAVTDKPLGDVLADLPPALSARLCAEREIAGQRVTLRLTDQAVSLVIDRLVRLMVNSFSAQVERGSPDQLDQAVLTFQMASYHPGTQVFIADVKIGGRTLVRHEGRIRCTSRIRAHCHHARYPTAHGASRELNTV